MNFTVPHSIPDCAEGGQLAKSRERDGGRGESTGVADIMVNSDRVRRWLGATMCRADGLGRFTAPLATSRRWFCLPYTLVGQTDSLGLGDETEDVAVPIKEPRKPALNHFEAGFVVPVEEASTYSPSSWRLVRYFPYWESSGSKGNPNEIVASLSGPARPVNRRSIR